jgi:hypothetical protein
MLDAVRSTAAPVSRRAVLHPGLPAGLVGFAPVVGLGAAQGGFFPSSWGWASVPLLWVVAAALALRDRVRLSNRERAFIVLLAAFCGWILLSAIWSVAPAKSILEAQRALVVVAGVAAVFTVSRSRFVSQLLGGVLAGITVICIFSLATRVLPDRVGVFDRTPVYRLAQPIGYWNGLALFAGMGALLAAGFAARARTLTGRALSAASLLIFIPTLYFTFGRAAWIALGAGLATAIAADRNRLQLVAALTVIVPAPTIAVLYASRLPGLTQSGASLASAERDGHRLAAVLVALAVANAILVAVLRAAETRVQVGGAARRMFAGVLIAALVASLAAVFIEYGGPATLARKGYDAFKAPPPHASTDLNRRLLSFSGNGRADLWRLAWDDARDHPVLGAGAGTYERYFLAHQPADVSRVRDAHGLYIETLAELGPIGLAVLLSALLLPLTVLRRVRHPLAAAATGAYAAYLVHTGVDWDWELTGVTFVGALCGVSLLLAARPSFDLRPLGGAGRWAVGAAAVCLSVLAAIGLTGNMALSRSNHALTTGDWTAAASSARTAHGWMPWSPAPWEALGRAQLGAGFAHDARESLREAIDLDSRDWELWYRLAAASQGNARRAALQQAHRLYPRAGFAGGASTSDSGGP